MVLGVVLGIVLGTGKVLGTLEQSYILIVNFVESIYQQIIFAFCI